MSGCGGDRTSSRSRTDGSTAPRRSLWGRLPSPAPFQWSWSWDSSPTLPSPLLIEYRTQAGFDQDLPASGVLIYHIDPKIKTNRPCNSCPQQYMVELLEADGNNTLRLNFLQGGSRGEAGDAWGVAGSGLLTNSTYPSTRLTSGTASPVTIYDISIEGGLAHITLSSVEVLESSLVQTFLETPGPGLTPEEVQYLDSYGNQNGQYDVGDLRAYLKR